MFHDVDVPECRRAAGPFTTVLRRDCSLSSREQQVHVVDAKSIYDTMQKEGNASAKDRRTALDLAIICEALERARGSVRWVPHERMPVDPLTKDDITKCNAALFDLMSHGRLILVDEGAELERRKAAPELKGRSQQASRREFESVQMSWVEFMSPGLVVGDSGGGGSSSIPTPSSSSSPASFVLTLPSVPGRMLSCGPGDRATDILYVSGYGFTKKGELNLGEILTSVAELQIFR
eukprot:9469693-Pyramimonas_sp.AAC.1